MSGRTGTEVLRRRAHEHLLMHFTRHRDLDPALGTPLVLERGDGVYLIDSAGRRYLDGMSSLFCAQLGYGYGGEMGEVASAQLAELPFANVWSAAHPAAVELASRLASLAPTGIEHAFFTSGGAESVEAAWKIARLYYEARDEPGRRKAIARRGAYHGVTLGALSFTGVEPVRIPFSPPAIDVHHVSNTNSFRRPEQGERLTAILLEELEQAILEEGPEEVALIVAEPIQNAGGCLLPPPGYWQGLRELSDRYGILLCADEVITGFGRLGGWFGGDRFGAAPDLIALAKGLTSAHAPMGALLVSERVAEAFFATDLTLLHGLTFGGHPLASAIALRNIEIFERDGVLVNVRANERYLQEGLESLLELPIVGDVRGAGFFWALELVADDEMSTFDPEQREELIRHVLPEELIRNRLLARGDDRGDTVLHLAPPLVSTPAEIDELVGRAGAVLEAAGARMAAQNQTSKPATRAATSMPESQKT